MLSHAEATALLSRYGIPIVPQRLAATEREAVEAAASLGGPVVLKLLAPGRSHKSDGGLVRLDLRTPEEVRAAAQSLLAAAAAGPVEGLLVQSMVRGAREAILGALTDPQFGPLVALGPGGIHVEAVDRVDFLMVPFGRAAAEAFLGRNALARLLAAGRGMPPGDAAALTDALLAMGSLIREHAAEIRSVDVNPLAVLPRGAVALDYRIEEAAP